MGLSKIYIIRLHQVAHWEFIGNIIEINWEYSGIILEDIFDAGLDGECLH